MFPIKDSQRSYSTPVATILIIVVNLMVFLYELSLEPYAQNHFTATYALVPARFHSYDLFTSMFLHGGWMHILGNMWFLWIFGDNIEDVLGHFKYLVFYILCGLAAGVTHVLLNADSRLPTVGASGAIAGVMGAYITKFPRNRITCLIFFGFIFFVDVPAVFMLGYWFLIQVFSGVGSVGYTNASQGGTAWFAHVGGFLAGIILVRLMAEDRRYTRRRDLYW
jgi:membrane associated rhomboid family serine protease